MMSHGSLQIPAGGKKGRGLKAGPLLACAVLAMLILGAMLGIRITNVVKHSRARYADEIPQAEESRCVIVSCLYRSVST